MELMQKLHTFRPKAIKNADGFLSIGYGHTLSVKEDQTTTENEARRILADDMAIYAGYVAKIVTVELTENQFSSLTAFCAHVSAAIFAKTDLVRLLNRGWYEQVPAQLRKWGEKQSGIHKVRRAAEAALWSTPEPTDEAIAA